MNIFDSDTASDRFVRKSRADYQDPGVVYHKCTNPLKNKSQVNFGSYHDPKRLETVTKQTFPKYDKYQRRAPAMDMKSMSKNQIQLSAPCKPVYETTSQIQFGLEGKKTNTGPSPRPPEPRYNVVTGQPVRKEAVFDSYQPGRSVAHKTNDVALREQVPKSHTYNIISGRVKPNVKAPPTQSQRQVERPPLDSLYALRPPTP